MNEYCPRTPHRRTNRGRPDGGWGTPSYGEQKACPIRARSDQSPFMQMASKALAYRLQAKEAEFKVEILKKALEDIKALPYERLKEAKDLADRALKEATTVVSETYPLNDDIIVLEEVT